MWNYHALFFIENFTHERHTFYCFTIKYKNLWIMDSNDEEDSNVIVTELEVVKCIEEEQKIEVKAILLE